MNLEFILQIDIFPGDPKAWPWLVATEISSFADKNVLVE